MNDKLVNGEHDNENGGSVGFVQPNGHLNSSSPQPLLESNSFQLDSDYEDDDEFPLDSEGTSITSSGRRRFFDDRKGKYTFIGHHNNHLQFPKRGSGFLRIITVSSLVYSG